MLMLDKTSERLRSKHVRTLELLQKTLDENAELRDRISQLQKVWKKCLALFVNLPRVLLSPMPTLLRQQGTLRLSHVDVSQVDLRLTNRTNELEDEIDRLRAEHCAKVVATEEAARVRRDELQKHIDALLTNQQKLRNDVVSLDTKLRHARETLQQERDEWHAERQRIVQENQSLQRELTRIQSSPSDSDSKEELYAAELAKLQCELDKQRNVEADVASRNDRLNDEMTRLCAETNQFKEAHATSLVQLEAAQQEFRALTQREATLSVELEAAKRQIQGLKTVVEKLECEYESAVSLQAQSALQQHYEQQYTTTLAQLHEMEDQNRRLLGENRSLQDALASLQTQHAEVSRTQSASATSSVFAAHMDLKRENFHLRAQVEEFKALQRRFLTTATKKTMKFPAI